MKSKLLLSLFSFLLLQAYSQKAKIKWSEIKKSDYELYSMFNGSGSELVKVSLKYGRPRSGFWSVIPGDITPMLTRYDEQLKVVGERIIKVNDDDVEFDKLFSVRGKIYMFLRKFEKKTLTTGYYCQAINLQTLNSEGELLKMAVIEEPSKKYVSKALYFHSIDSSKIFTFIEAASEKNQNKKYSIIVFDSDMKRLWSKSIELPCLSQFMEILDYKVTNDGKVLLVYKHFDQNVRKEAIKNDGEKKPAYKIKVLVYDKDKPDASEYVVDLGDKYPIRVDLANESKENVLLFGLYKNLDYGRSNGFFTMSYDKATGKFSNSSLSDFPAELGAKAYAKREIDFSSKPDPGLSKYYGLIQTVIREDGSRDFILQYQDNLYVQTKSGGYYKYLYRDIVDICLAPDNKVSYSRIPLSQESSVPVFCGFEAMAYQDNLLIFYNDKAKNAQKGLDEDPSTLIAFGGSDFVMAKIDKKGNVTRTVLYNNRDQDLTTALGHCFQIARNKMILFARAGIMSNGKKNQVGVLEIE